MFEPIKCTLTIDLSLIRANYRILSAMANQAILGAVVKANCYGLGAVKIATALYQEGCRDFFVATLDEAIELQESLGNNIAVTSNKLISNSTNIFVLSGVSNTDAKDFDQYKLIPVLNNLAQLQIWNQLASNKNTKLPAILHFNTGMHRLGIPHEEIEIIQQNPNLLNGLELLYIMSHLSTSTDADHIYNRQQLEKLKNYRQYFPEIKVSLANSSSIFLGADYHYDLIRPGAALYGINPTPRQPNPMQHVVSLTAPIIQLQSVLTGNAISYDMTFITKRDTIIATLPIGYADGYPRALSNRGKVYIAGHSAPIVGTISMDLMVVDVTDIPSEQIFLGQQVEIIGDYYTIDQLAEDAGTIAYEILTRLGKRYHRIYKTD
ncbi:Alanine racemase [Candidatus Trichorickettsia mobilis]|uniref:Alanine racemase n=1 Tax=Candidatus Trichorickettsia mobilis TaxID=1346319 RepID=A0ABZ0UV31_9RICK|nr:alanine racemase [Candidatus Trichorickettsia mobilis]WPY00942.1 Alanine racemase [Candidatus Trichorickettsia mobilis]